MQRSGSASFGVFYGERLGLNLRDQSLIVDFDWKNFGDIRTLTAIVGIVVVQLDI